ncbi:MAG: hypothetical protein M1821_001310 [Bathelium mastoideum]|nr:MAG: hypothetical protein M1821_001310 [Bathelium mastoideum]
MEIGDEELGEIYEFAVQLGKDAGRLLMDGAKSRFGDTGSGQQAFVEKESSVDIVTKTDEGEFKMLKSANGKEKALTYSPTWCIDPLDGTVNYTHLFPMFCVSIGFVVGGKPVIGVINAPFLQQLFSACRGRGAWLNEAQRLPLVRNPIPPMPENAPKQCIFAFEWGKDRRDRPDGNLHRKVESFVNMAAEIGGRGGKGGMVHGMRSLGSATMDLAYTAMGAFDLWWEGGCWEWDVAAGIAILQEAGGLVTTAHPPEDPSTAVIEDVKLGGRLYLAIRPAGPSGTESGRETQERAVREVWKRVKGLDYARPGIE